MSDIKKKSKGPFIESLKSIEDLTRSFRNSFSEGDDFVNLFTLTSNRIDSKGYAVGVYEDFLYILHDESGEIEEVKVEYKNIECIKHTNELLLGRLELIAGEKTIAFDYNVVSRRLVNDVVNLIRKKYISYEQQGLEFVKELPENLEQLMHVLLEKIDIRVVDYVYQPETKLREEEMMIESFLLTSMHLIGDHEMITIDKGKEIKGENEVSYGYGMTYVPLDKIKSVTQAPHKIFSSVYEIDLNLSKNKVRYLFSADNKDREKFMKLM